MPVEPIPCEPGGGSGPVEVTTCCAPSIASTALCRADGSTVLLVVRSGCVECGEAAADPAVVGWINAATGVFTAGNAPADTGSCTAAETAGCCSPSITSATLCREDGTSILVVVRSACLGCAEDPTDPVVVGWFDLGTGLFTAGAAPAGAGPCETGCVDTVCRQLCDDTDGDGAADATYSELWCVRADGTVDLVLTYQANPSVPYTPVAPVDCEYGSTASEVVTLCDGAGPFLRRYSWLGDIASFEDVALDGATPYVVTGAVGVCAAVPECEAPTTPAATLGLCLADGTPIAVLVTRDCAGTVTQDGWLNLTTGAYSVGDPPVGTMACGNPRSISTTGTFCDVDPGTGDVLGLVLIEYTYGAGGDVTAVRLVDATTGTTYVPQGEVTTCPAGVAQPERDLVQLCDTAPDGTITEFVRDFARDENGAIVGHADYTLTGAAYTPTGAVGACQDQGLTCTDHVLCDVAAGGFEPATMGVSAGTMGNGLAWTVAEGAAMPTQAFWVMNASAPQVWTFSDVAAVTWSARMGVIGACIVMPAGTVPVDINPGHSYDPATRTLCRTTGAGDAESSFSHPGTDTLVFTQAGTGATLARQIGLVTAAVIESTTFLRSVCRDRDGTVVSITDTALDGATPYMPAGDVGQCTAPLAAPCQDCTTHLLCDTDPSPVATITGTAAAGTLTNGVAWTSTAPGAFPPSKQGDGAAWWGVALFPNPSVPNTVWTFDQPVNVEFSVIMNWNPGAGATQNQVQLPPGAVPIVLPPGYTYDRDTRILLADNTLTPCTISAPTRANSARFRVTGISSVALRYLGTRAINTDCRVFGHWIFGALDVSLGGEFQRTVCRDCTGAVVSSTDTTLTGTPYAPVGAVGLCHPPAPCPSTVEILQLCDLNPAAEPDPETGLRCAVPFLRHLVHDCAGALLDTRDTGMDGLTPYTSVKVTDCGSGVPALAELLWPQTGIAEDPAGVVRQDFIYTVTNPETEEVAEVRLHASTSAGGACGAYNPAAPVFNNPTTYTLTLSAAAQEMSTFRLDLLDFDTFEGITNLSPLPSRVEGDVTWNGGTTITANQNNVTARVYFDNPPATIVYRYGNTGGGTACSAVAFQGMTLIPEGCCGCDAAGTAGTDAEVLTLCDAAADGEVTAFLRHLRYAPDGTEAEVTDTALDGTTTYVPLGTVGVCSGAPDEQCVPLALGEVCYSPPVVVPDAPLPVSNLVMQGAFFGDSPGEDICNVVPAPTSEAGWTINGACRHPAVPSPSLGWAGPLQSAELEYGDGATPQGGVFVSFSSDETGPITWPANMAPMTLGEQRVSNLLTGGRYARLTYVSGPVDGSQPVQLGGPTIGIQIVAGSAIEPPIRFRLETFGPGGVASGDTARAAVTQACDGTVTYTDILTGTVLDPTAVTVGQCASDNTAAPDIEATTLCDVDGAGVATPFLRHIGYLAGVVASITDTTLDGTTPYAAAGTVGTCAASAADEPGVDTELVPLCVVDNASGGILQRILAEVRYDQETGVRLSVTYVDPVTWGPVPVPGGARIDLCPAGAEECAANTVIQACRCDDADGDGIADADYVEFLAVDCEGALTSLGTYTADLSAPYTPVAPIDCAETEEGAEPAIGVQARRVELAAGQTWDAAAWSTLQSVTAIAHGGTGTVTTADGPSTLHTGEAATWSVARDTDALLTGPLTITADTGTVTLSYTIGVLL